MADAQLSGDALRRYNTARKTQEGGGYLAKHYDANHLFATQPMNFFRQNAVVPPSNLAGVRMESKGTVWTDALDTPQVKSGMSVAQARVKHLAVPTRAGVARINFERSTGNEKGAMTFNAGRTGVPVHFLPWESLSVVSLRIPDTGGAFYEPDDADNPGLFFTAAINGCSVFVRGSTHAPEIFHAGINGEFHEGVSAVTFWQNRMRDLLAGRGPGGGHPGELREANKTHYIRDPNNSDPTTTATAASFEQWLKTNQSDEFRVQAVSAWGCVFGIRFGRAWSFYLQENATTTILRYVKKQDVKTVKTNNREETLLKSTGDVVRTEKVALKRGPFTVNKKIYMATQTYSRPLQIREIFPNGGSAIKIKDEIKRI